MNTAYNEGHRAAQRGFKIDDNPYQSEPEASQWEEGFCSYEPKQKIRKRREEWA